MSANSRHSGTPANTSYQAGAGRGKPGGAQPVNTTKANTTNPKRDSPSTSDLFVEGKQLFSSLPTSVQELIEHESGQDIEQKAATFIVHSMKDNKPIVVNKEDFEKIAKVADPAILQKSTKDMKDKVLKSKDGKSINISELLDKRTRAGSGTKGKGDTPPNLQDSENDQLPERQNSDLEKKLNDRVIELAEKEKDLSQKDQDLLLKTEEYTVLKKKYDELETENKELCERYDANSKEMKEEIRKLKNTVGELRATLGEKEADIRDKHATIGNMEQQMEEANSRFTSIENERLATHMQYQETRGALDKAKRTIDHMKEAHEDALRHKENQLKEIVADRDDLRYRFSKLAGAKLTDQNPDIADLSDPNRAMKLSEKFGGLYDDQWTDAFEHLKGKKKMSVKDSITLLLDVLKKCEAFCEKLKETQMDSLRNVLLHPSQDVSSFGSEPRKHVGGLKEQARIKSDDQKAVRELRRQIGVRENVLEEVKQVFILESKSWPEKKALEGCIPYLQRCAEICWLMVLHDPPLYMKMDVVRGDHFDTGLYSVYSASGDKIDYLVWPALFNDKNGGLLSKGTAEPFKTVKKT